MPKHPHEELYNRGVHSGARWGGSRRLGVENTPHWETLGGEQTHPKTPPQREGEWGCVLELLGGSPKSRLPSDSTPRWGGVREMLGGGELGPSHR